MKNLKNILIILTLSFLFSCSDSVGIDEKSSDASDDTSTTATSTAGETGTIDDVDNSIVVVDETDDTETIIEPLNPITISIISNETLYFFNGEINQQLNINPKNCGYRCFTDGSTKVFYDEFREIESTELLFMEPDFIIDDWIVENIEPAEALAIGARYKDYTRYYFQGIEYGNWFLNEYKVTDFKKTLTGEIIGISGNTFYPVVSDLGIINHADKLLIYDFDGANRTATINNTSVSWVRNYFNQSRQWQFLDGVWYSWNGYEFTDDLQEFANALWNWNEGEKPINVTGPTLINAGVDQSQLYWVECNTGWLVSYHPETDQITLIFQLYLGDGLRLSGIEKSLSLKPVLIDGVLYYNNNGLRKIDIVTGASELVMGVNGDVKKW